MYLVPFVLFDTKRKDLVKGEQPDLMIIICFSSIK
jgi:hypothetical protein